jgi:hypothetical protein
MSDVQKVTVQISPARDNDPGSVTFGYFKIDADGVLIMTDGDGVPVRRQNGEYYKHRLEPDDNPRAIAAKLTREIRRMAHGETVAGFHQKLEYPKLGIV